MKRKTIFILILVMLIVIIGVLRWISNTDVKKEELKVVRVEPIENSQILASNGEILIKVSFSKSIDQTWRDIEIEDSFGFNWQKELTASNVLSLVSPIDKTIMSVEEILLEVGYENEIIKQWRYEVPFDEKMAGDMVEPVYDEDASFIPSQEDIDYFREQEKIMDKEQPLRKELPFETDKFKISHYIEPLKLVVYVKNGDKKEIEIEVDKWIEANGGNSGEHTIEWR